MAKAIPLALLGFAGRTPLSPASRPTSDMARAAEINVQLGIEYLKEGELNQALNKLERAVQQDPTLPSAHSSGLAQQRLGQAKEAERYFQRAIKLAPDQNNYSVFLFSQGRYQEAEERFWLQLKIL